MREILFRGKRFDNGEWVFGCYYKQTQFYGDEMEEHIIITSNEDLSYDQALQFGSVESKTVGQFTGLTDKNGKKIFEGDIVRVCLDPEICVGDVIWDSDIASYNIPFNNGKCVLPLDIFVAKNKVGDKVWIEVIGNIHDNPELLGGAEDG